MRLAVLRWVYRWSAVASLLLAHVLALPILFAIAWCLGLPRQPMIWMCSAIVLVQLAWAVSIDWRDQRS